MTLQDRQLASSILGDLLNSVEYIFHIQSGIFEARYQRYVPQ